MTNADTWTTAAVVEQLRSQRTRLLTAVDGLGEGASTTPVTEPGGWSAKDVLAHLIHYAGQIAFGLGASLTPPAYVLGVSERLTGQEWNELAVAHWRDATLEDVTAEFVAVTDQLIDQAAARVDGEWARTDTIPWGEGQPLWQFVGGDTFLAEWPARHRSRQPPRAPELTPVLA